jgi:hypothetical protein
MLHRDACTVGGERMLGTEPSLAAQPAETGIASDSLTSAAALYDRAIVPVLQASMPTQEQSLSTCGQILSALIAQFPDLAFTPTPTGREFLSAGAPDPSGQMDEVTFLRETAQQFLILTGGAGDPQQLATLAMKLLQAIQPLGSTEAAVRQLLDLAPNASHDPRLVARVLAQRLSENANTWKETLPTQQEPPTEADSAGVLSALNPTGALAALTSIMSGGPWWFPDPDPSDGGLGNRVHERLQRQYADAWPTHFVVREGKYRIHPRPYGQDDLDRLLGQLPPPLPPPFRMRAAALRAAIKKVDPIKPDIADLDDNDIFGTPLTQEWGWFEIKPYKKLSEAVKQLLEYVRKYEQELLILTGGQDQKGLAIPGGWAPFPVYFDAGPPKPRLVIIGTVLWGVILYWPFDLHSALTNVLEGTEATFLFMLSAALALQAISKIGKLLPQGSRAPAVPENALLRMVLILVIVLGAVLLLRIAAPIVVAAAGMAVRWLLSVAAGLLVSAATAAAG